MADAQLSGSALLAVVVGGAIAAIIGVIVGASSDGVKALVRSLRGRFRTWRTGDHAAIDSGGGIGTDHGGRRQFCVTVKLAPSARLAGGFELDVDTVEQWVTNTFGPGRFEVDASNPRELVRYMPSGGQFGEVPMVTVFPTGAIEYLQPFEHGFDDKGQPVLDVTVIARYISTLAASVNAGGLRPIYAQSRFSRRRIDWRVSVSPSISASDGVGGSSSLMWSALHFDGPRPTRRAVRQNPPITQVGYGFSRLTNVSQSTPPPEVVRAVIKAFLEESGYVGLENCLAGICAPDSLLDVHRLQ